MAGRSSLARFALHGLLATFSSPLKIRLCFRLDDPHACSDHSLETAIFALFAKYDVPLCAAVIPFYRIAGSESLVGACRDNMPHVAEGLRAGRIELAQHGCLHLRATTSGEQRSEFAGVDEAMQTKRTIEGRRQLEAGFSTVVNGFVPPWNSYDETTTRVLGKARFRFISAGIKAPKYPRNAKPISGPIAVPLTCNLKSLESAIEQALRFRRASPAVVCVLHPDEFEEFRDPPALGEQLPFMNLQGLERKLAWFRSIPEVSTCSIGDLAEEALAGGSLMHVTDAWWYCRVPQRFRQRLPHSILFRSGPSSLLPGVIGLV